MSCARPLKDFRVTALAAALWVVVGAVGARPALADSPVFGLGLDQLVPPTAVAELAPPPVDLGKAPFDGPEEPLEPAPDGLGHPKGLLLRFRDDLPALAFAPLEWHGSDWRKLGLGVLVVGAVRLVDEPTHHWIDAHHSQGFESFSTSIRPLGREGGLALLGAAWLYGRATDRSELEATSADALEASIISAGLIAPALKLAFGRARPRDADVTAEQRSGGDSFPSGEATEAFAIASVVAAHSDKTWVKATAWGLAGLLGLGRMETDGHYASDVVAGALIGAAVGRWVVKRNRPELESGHSIAVTPIIGRERYGVAMSMSF